jgi:hypothetical protein
MDFEQAILALESFVGEQVKVDLLERQPDLVTATGLGAPWEGRLSRDPQAPDRFIVGGGEEPTGGIFVVNAASFRDGEWLRPDALRFQHGAQEITVTRAPSE